jgi:glucose-1-phosphate cytidylyltransferase
MPKPMVPIGYRPILWHLMKYYAHHGHRDFILCLGYRGDVIKQYFLNYDECLTNDFALSNGGRAVELYNRDIDDWKITFVDTGLNANIGMRLKAVEHYLQDEPMFLANYADGLTDLPLPDYMDFVQKHDRVATFLSVRPSQFFHVVDVENGGRVRDISAVQNANLWINGGFFALKREIFDYIKPGEELVDQPFQRLIAGEQLMAYTYKGFWQCMDTFKDKQLLDDMTAKGTPPWEVWRTAARAAGATTLSGPARLGVAGGSEARVTGPERRTIR